MLGVSGTPVLDAVGKLGDLGDRLGGKRTFSILTYGLMTRPAEQPVGCVYDTYSALRYDLMGIIPQGGFPCDWTLTIRFGMAVDAIKRLRIYLPA